MLDGVATKDITTLVPINTVVPNGQVDTILSIIAINQDTGNPINVFVYRRISGVDYAIQPGGELGNAGSAELVPNKIVMKAGEQLYAMSSGVAGSAKMTTHVSFDRDVP